MLIDEMNNSSLFVAWYHHHWSINPWPIHLPGTTWSLNCF